MCRAAAVSGSISFATPSQLSAAQHFVHAFLVAVVLSPASYGCGQLVGRLHLPRITGYLISGIVCGPYVLGILSVEGVSSLSIIEGATLSIIGLAAGAELHLAELARLKRAVLSITIAICLITWVLVYCTLLYTTPVAAPALLLSKAADSVRSHVNRRLLELVTGAGAQQVAPAAAAAQEAMRQRFNVAVASLGATLMMARSPASAVRQLPHYPVCSFACKR